MAKYSIIFGILLSALLYCLLTLSRLGKYEEPDMKILEVEVVEMPAPPAPPEMEVPEEEPDDLPPPPTPDIDMVETLAPLDQPVIELSPNKISITTPVETFRQTNAVADLPAPPVVKKAAPKKAVVPVSYTHLTLPTIA